MRSFLIRLFVNAVALYVAAWWVPGIRISDGFLNVLWIALVFGLVNAILKPILMLLSLPLLLLTLGLFTFVVNAALLMLTAALTDGMAVDGWGAALLGSIAVSVVSIVLGVLVGGDDKD